MLHHSTNLVIAPCGPFFRIWSNYRQKKDRQVKILFFILKFNVYLSEYNKEISEILNTGIYFEGKLFKIKIHLFIADAPARAKACNSKQFNGEFGYLKCLHPTIYRKTSLYPSLKEVQKHERKRNMPITSQICLRSNEIYLEQAESAEESGMVVKGIKG